MAAYYNENDTKTAAWLRELIKVKLIADGEVDTRSITDVQPGDLRGFVQCHFFAGIGGWSYALRLAGWDDDRRVWTGSCPCQPWSMAGTGKGTDDPRHLWPAWKRLVEVCRPSVVFGEQTASLDGLYWLDLVYADMEAQDYAFAAADISGACLGSPDIRARLWFVADTDGERYHRGGVNGPRWWFEPADGGAACDCGHRSDEHQFGRDECLACSCTFWLSATRGMEHAERGRTGRSAGSKGRPERQAPRSGEEGCGFLQAIDSSAARGVADSYRSVLEKRGFIRRMEPSEVGASTRQDIERDSLLGGFWADCEWVYCQPEPRYPEGCYRPIEPGSFPLAAGLPARILRLRGYGNSIKPHVAAAFIAAYMEVSRNETRESCI